MRKPLIHVQVKSRIVVVVAMDFSASINDEAKTFMKAAVVSPDSTAQRATTLGTTQGQIHGFFSGFFSSSAFKCYLPEVASVGG